MERTKEQTYADSMFCLLCAVAPSEIRSSNGLRVLLYCWFNAVASDL